MAPDADYTDWMADHVVPRTESLPEDPPAGDYVVIDVLYFTTTAVEILHHDAEYLHIPEKRGAEPAYREEHPRTLIGGESTLNGNSEEPVEGYDFFNSPSYVNEVDFDGRPAAMTSTNGARAVNQLHDIDGVDVYVASTTNARATADHLRTRDRPTRLVCAGTRGEANPEDRIGAILIGRLLHDLPPLSPPERAVYEDAVVRAKGDDYVDDKPRRRKDILEYCTAFDSRDTVARLDGRNLCRVDD